jgi:hypothetical protein
MEVTQPPMARKVESIGVVVKRGLQFIERHTWASTSDGDATWTEARAAVQASRQAP